MTDKNKNTPKNGHIDSDLTDNTKRPKNNTKDADKLKDKGRKHARLRSDIITNYLASKSEPVTTKAIAAVLGRGSKRGLEETEKLLEQLRDQNKIRQIRRHRWATIGVETLVTGKVVGHVDGHGYVLPEEGGDKIYLRSHDMREAMHNDIVKVRVTGRDRRKKRLGQISEIVQRGNEQVVGRYYQERGLNFVVPQDQRISQDIFIAPDSLPKPLPESGQVVLCDITQQPSKNFQPVGVIAKILGDYLAPGMEIEIATHEFEIPHVWPQAVLNESEKFGAEVNGDDFPHRKDIRQLPLVTIDGEDARDFDDAVFCEPNAAGFRLVVAIADVSHYVKKASALDEEAWLRGNSVYFPRQVIPMLPEVLSNGLCSLNPQVDRLCMVCDMQFSKQGVRTAFEFYPAVMHSHARLTYTQVAAFLEPTNADASASKSEPIETKPHGIDDELSAPITQLFTLSKLLGRKRREHGSIDLAIAEPVILFNDERKIESVIPRERNVAHQLIEECMLAANICAADQLAESKLASIYRVHEQPDTEKVVEARQFIRQFGELLGGGDTPTPLDYAKLINKLEDPITIRVVHQALLRSFKQARYSEENDGHFALSFDSYTHFTSPIRRYADLHVHRQLKQLIKEPSFEDGDKAFAAVVAMSEQTSITERRAEKASRAVTQWLKCEFMRHRIGETYTGIINTVTDFGLFVELEECFIEGLIHITALGDDYYRFDEVGRVLSGENNGQTFRAGQKIEIQIARVDLEQRRIDFDLLNKHSNKVKRSFQKKGRKNSYKADKKTSAKKRKNTGKKHPKKNARSKK